MKNSILPTFKAALGALAFALGIGVSATSVAAIGNSYLIEIDARGSQLVVNTVKNGTLFDSVILASDLLNSAVPFTGLYDGATLPFDSSVSYNIFEPAGGPLSNVMSIEATAGTGAYFVMFDGSPSGSLAGGTSITENGQLQLVFSQLVSNNDQYTFGFVSGVPEPQTYAMMLGGLGLLAFVARRRKA